MYKLLKPLLLIFVSLLGALCFAPPCYAQDKIVAIVNNEIITQKDLNDFANFMRIQLAAEYKGDRLEEKIQSMKADMLQRLIEDRLILQQARKEGIRIDEARVKARVEELKRQYPSDGDFQDSLAQEGLVQADIEARVREQLSMYAIIDSKIKSKLVVTPGEVTDFYQKESGKFNIPEQREFESIALEDPTLAEEIARNLKAGKNIDELAKAYNFRVDKITGKKGEDLRKEIEEVVFKLNLGEVSQPVKIEAKYYIFRLDKAIAPRKENLSEVQDKIYSFLLNLKMQEKLTNWVDELKKNSYIKICQEG